MYSYCGWHFKLWKRIMFRLRRSRARNCALYIWWPQSAQYCFLIYLFFLYIRVCISTTCHGRGQRPLPRGLVLACYLMGSETGSLVVRPVWKPFCSLVPKAVDRKHAHCEWGHCPPGLLFSFLLEPGPEEVAMWLTVLAAFTEDLSSVPKTHMAAHNCL